MLILEHLFKEYLVRAAHNRSLSDEEAISWMLLTTEIVATNSEALTILQWYTYRWLIEEYHKILITVLWHRINIQSSHFRERFYLLPRLSDP